MSATSRWIRGRRDRRRSGRSLSHIIKNIFNLVHGAGRFGGNFGNVIQDIAHLAKICMRHIDQAIGL